MSALVGDKSEDRGRLSDHFERVLEAPQELLVAHVELGVEAPQQLEHHAAQRARHERLRVDRFSAGRRGRRGELLDELVSNAAQQAALDDLPGHTHVVKRAQHEASVRPPEKPLASSETCTDKCCTGMFKKNEMHWCIYTVLF